MVKKIKLLTALLLTLTLLVSAAALAEEQSPWQYDSYNYYLKLEGTLNGDVTVPAEVNGYAVNAI